jgi:hypothetical protein
MAYEDIGRLEVTVDNGRLARVQEVHRLSMSVMVSRYIEITERERERTWAISLAKLQTVWIGNCAWITERPSDEQTSARWRQTDTRAEAKMYLVSGGAEVLLEVAEVQVLQDDAEGRDAYPNRSAWNYTHTAQTLKKYIAVITVRSAINYKHVTASATSTAASTQKLRV